ncbi:hypothetical protein HF680_13460 [Brevundimonas sp. WCHBH090558]|uniref:hypothetical protein n=1 Tax=Brevundimonas huaxiensis TaxID=2725493 RepID=UPI0016232EBE|nr:hypothetical protein [Brevundimonas huaxiensis]MBC1183660.1 hypothetical protein [Brevundimonas huaxiensis]
MTQDEINGMLAAALDDAQKRIDVQEKCIEMLVDQIEDMAHQMTGVLEEARVARLHYAEQRKRLGLTVDVTGGSLIGGGFGIPGG